MRLEDLYVEEDEQNTNTVLNAIDARVFFFFFFLGCRRGGGETFQEGETYKGCKVGSKGGFHENSLRSEWENMW